MAEGGDKVVVAKRGEEEAERDDRRVVVAKRGEKIMVGSLCWDSEE